MTIREAAAGLRARRFSAVELATAAMARIERHNPKPVRVHHHHRRAGAGTGAAGGPRVRHGQRPGTVSRHSGGAQGPVSRQGSAHHGGLQGLRKLRAGGQRHGSGETGGGGRGARWASSICTNWPTGSLRPIRTSARSAIRGTRSTVRADRAAARAPRWRRIWSSWRWAAIPAARSASRRRSAGPWDSSPRMGASAGLACCRWASAWTTWGRSRARCATPRWR